ncbi:FtsQ-type POTRA domain-containing protein [Nitrospiraceae bacterium AH_259_D15_M11_P09]|nr:FtsQ-type POTRA domain-containing protein [Nitrospiraceae bacterium AH_259_D15_M11_P09]
MSGWFRRKQVRRPNVQTRVVRARSVGRQSGLVGRVGRVTVWATAFLLGGWGTAVVYWEARPLLAGWFEIREIQLTGDDRVPRHEIMKLLELPPGETLLSVSPAQVVAQVESHPLIKEATLTRRLPHTLAIHITERRAAAMLRGSSLTLLLDQEGQVLSVLTARRDSGLPVLVGIDPNLLILGEPRAVQAAQVGIKLASLLGRSLEGRPEVDVGDPDHAVAYIKGMRFQFGSTLFEEQLGRYRQLGLLRRADIPDQLEDIDLRFPGKVIVRKRG